MHDQTRVFASCDVCIDILGKKKKLAQRISDCSSTSTEKPIAKDNSESMMAPADESTAFNPLRTSRPAHGDLLQRQTEICESCG